VVIFPVPMEKTVSYLPGTAGGPARILEASRQVELYDPELDTSPYRAGIHTAEPIDCRGDSAACLEKIEAAVRALKGRAVPVCLGGEHTLTLGAVRALRAAGEEFSVLQLDAHADLRESYGGSPFSHASVMRRVRELGVPLVSVGVRSLAREEADYIAAEQIPIYPGWKFADRDYPWAEIAGALEEKVYISIDLDAFDPSQVPGVGTPEPGGLSWNQALDLFRALRRSGKTLVGADLVELCPLDGSIVSEFFAARLLYKLIGYFFTPQGERP
jgi:agmatinase